MVPAINKNIPIPPRQEGRTPYYPFAEMKPGDSFAVPWEQETNTRTAAYHHAQRYGRRYTTRKRLEGGKEVLRVWRVE